MDKKIRVLGVDINDLSEEEAISKILKLAKDPKGCHLVVTVNSEIVMLAQRDSKFSEVLKNADLCLADSVGVVLAKLISGGKAHSRITGTDLVDKLCAASANKPIRVGFLGGFRGVAERVSQRQKSKYPGLKVAYWGSGDPTIGQDLRLRKEIGACGRLDILFVAYGMGKQEFWIARNLKYLNVGLAIGVGGAFDYIAGVKKRAPNFVQKFGLEWLWRLAWEPARVWRMRVLPIFLVMVIFQFFSRKIIRAS